MARPQGHSNRPRRAWSTCLPLIRSRHQAAHRSHRCPNDPHHGFRVARRDEQIRCAGGAGTFCCSEATGATQNKLCCGLTIYFLGEFLCCRFPNRGVQNGQAAGRRTRAHRCRHRGRFCGHAGSARADGMKNKPRFVVGLDLRITVRKQLSCGLPIGSGPLLFSIRAEILLVVCPF